MNGNNLKLELRIDWSELDLFGHVNNIAILKYVQAARVNFLEITGLMQLKAETQIGPILASTTCQFLKSLYYPGNVIILSKVEIIKNTSFQLNHKIIDDKNQTIAEAHDIIVYYDFNINTKLTILDDLRQKILNP